jgi:hypothetical protein
VYVFFRSSVCLEFVTIPGLTNQQKVHSPDQTGQKRERIAYIIL